MAKNFQEQLDEFKTHYPTWWAFIASSKIKLNECKNGTDVLHQAVRLGLTDLVAFLYQEIGVEYDNSLLKEHLCDVWTEEFIPGPVASQQDVLIETGLSDKVGLRIEIMDANSQKRRECLAYLAKMKRYSIMRSEKTKFYYRFNKERYKDETLE